MNLNFLVHLLKIVIVRSIFGLNLKFKVENNNNIFLLRRVKALILRLVLLFIHVQIEYSFSLIRYFKHCHNKLYFVNLMLLVYDIR